MLNISHSKDLMDEKESTILYQTHTLARVENEMGDVYPNWYNEVCVGKHKGMVMKDGTISLYGEKLALDQNDKFLPREGKIVDVWFEQGDHTKPPRFVCKHRVEQYGNLEVDLTYDSMLKQLLDQKPITRTSKDRFGEEFTWTLVAPNGVSKRLDPRGLITHVLLDKPMDVAPYPKWTGLPSRRISRPEAGLLCKTKSDKKPIGDFLHLGESHELTCEKCSRLLSSLRDYKEISGEPPQGFLFANDEE